MPQGVAILDQLGVLPQILAEQAVTFRGIRYRNQHGQWAVAEFPSAADRQPFGVVMRRFQLDYLLLSRARLFSNVTTREGFCVTEVIVKGGTVQGVSGHSVHRPDQKELYLASLTIGADGSQSVFHHHCGLTKTYLRRKRFGITGHLEGVSGLGSYVEVLLHPCGEIYVAPCGPGTATVALLLEKRAMSFFRGNLPGRYLEFLRSVEGFRERVSRSKLLPPVFAVGPLGFTVDRCYGPGLLLVGDSAGFLDPLTGQGITLALKSAQAALPVIERAFATGDFSTRVLAEYGKARLELVQDLFLFTRLLLALSRCRFLADRVVRRLSHDKPLLEKLMGVVAGSNRYRDLSWGEKLGLLRG